MAKLEWDGSGKRYFEAGVDRGVLYVQGKAIPWNGITNIRSRSVGGENNPIYIDALKQRDDYSPEDFELTLNAYTYPEEFTLCDGMYYAGEGVYFDGQPRQTFDLSYRTGIGNDLNSSHDANYKIHLVYNATAMPTERSNDTIDDDPEPYIFSWVISCVPMTLSGRRPTAHITIDSRQMRPSLLAEVEGLLYGTDTSPAFLPSPDQIATLAIATFLRIDLNTTTGMNAAVVPNGASDIYGLPDDGLYMISANSRLRDPESDGLFTIG